MKKYSFIKPDPTLKNNLMAFGYECGKGWYPLIEELFDKMQEFVNTTEYYKDLEVVQVKEKFGELRVYINLYWNEIESLIDEYTEKSTHICELCGSKEAKARDKHRWYKTLCDNCFKEW